MPTNKPKSKSSKVRFKRFKPVDLNVAGRRRALRRTELEVAPYSKGINKAAARERLGREQSAFLKAVDKAKGRKGKKY